MHVGGVVGDSVGMSVGSGEVHSGSQRCTSQRVYETACAEGNTGVRTCKFASQAPKACISHLVSIASIVSTASLLSTVSTVSAARRRRHGMHACPHQAHGMHACPHQAVKWCFSSSGTPSIEYSTPTFAWIIVTGHSDGS